MRTICSHAVPLDLKKMLITDMNTRVFIVDVLSHKRESDLKSLNYTPNYDLLIYE